MKKRIEEALARSSLPVKWGTAPHEHDLYAMLTDAATRERDLAAIREYAPRAEQFAERDQHQLYLAMVHRAMGVAHCLAGEYANADTRLKQAFEIFQKLGTHWQLGRTLSELGELEQARQNDRVAYDYFSRALGEFDAMRAAPDAQVTRMRLQSLSKGGTA